MRLSGSEWCKCFIPPTETFPLDLPAGKKPRRTRGEGICTSAPLVPKKGLGRRVERFQSLTVVLRPSHSCSITSFQGECKSSNGSPKPGVHLMHFDSLARHKGLLNAELQSSLRVGNLLIKSHGSRFGCSVTNCSRHNNLTIKRPHGRLPNTLKKLAKSNRV